MSDYSNYTAEQETQLVVKILKDSKNLNLRCPSLHCKFVMQNERDVKKHLSVAFIEGKAKDASGPHLVVTDNLARAGLDEDSKAHAITRQELYNTRVMAERPVLEGDLRCPVLTNAKGGGQEQCPYTSGNASNFRNHMLKSQDSSHKDYVRRAVPEQVKKCEEKVPRAGGGEEACGHIEFLPAMMVGHKSREHGIGGFPCSCGLKFTTKKKRKVHIEDSNTHSSDEIPRHKAKNGSTAAPPPAVASEG